MAQLYDKTAAYASSLYVLTTLLFNTQRPANPHLIFFKENDKIAIEISNPLLSDHLRL